MGDGKNTNVVALVAAFVVGLLIGWFVLGWLLFPTSYTNAFQQDLRDEDKQAYIQTVAEAYQANGDAQKALRRLQALGTQEEVQALAGDLVQAAVDQGDLETANQVSVLAVELGVTLPQATPGEPQAGEPTVVGEETPAPPTDEGGPLGSLLGVCRASLGILLLLGGIALALWLLSKRRSAGGDESDQQDTPVPPDTAEVEVPDWSAEQDQPDSATTMAPPGVPVPPDRPFGREFTAVLIPGDPSYDESFDIEAPDGGGYLGECGLTISEMINGDPNRVTAVEVWLFDKSDIRTVTKVLMSDYAYGNQALRDKLSSRGDAVLAQIGESFSLTAQTLRLEGQISDLEYAEGESPQHGSFRRLSVKLRVSIA